ncbi:putative mitochondrial protein AtMg00240 [Silene latifolia]|uniref:putative mitochondrial protein AtMg00240 n=1 Tax=Silene latifolia TaxID=37657 RepID=UPI003D77B297
MTRPDINYSVQHLSQFVSQPRKPHFQAAIHVLQYLKGTVNTGLFYSADSDLHLTAYTDADWGQCSFFCKSLSGYCIFLASHSYHGRLRNKRQSPKAVQSQNIAACHTPVQN